MLHKGENRKKAGVFECSLHVRCYARYFTYIIMLTSSRWVDFQDKVIHQHTHHEKSLLYHSISVKGYYQCLGETVKVEP